MENILLKILDNEHNRIDNIRFTSDSDISFLKEYKHFAYNVDFYKGTNKVSTQIIDVFITHINNNVILFHLVVLSKEYMIKQSSIRYQRMTMAMNCLYNLNTKLPILLETNNSF